MNEDDPLRILMVEDVPEDAELAERELRKDGLRFATVRVDTKEGFLKALEEFRPEMIIPDYAMPEFDGMEALKLSLAHDPQLPFILFTGSMNEETAVACMKAGASDYIIKERMARLPAAVRGALEQRKIRIEKEERERELLAIYENAPLIMLLMDGERRLHKVNGFAAEFTGRPADAMRLMRCGEALRCLNALASPAGCGFGEQCEQCIIRRRVLETLANGKDRHPAEGSLWLGSTGQEEKMSFLLSTAKLDFGSQPLVLVTLLDITRRKQAEEALKESETLLNETQAISKVGGWAYDLRKKRITWTEEVYRIYGVGKSYDPNDIGNNIRLYSGEDRLIIEQAFTNAVQTGEPYDLELRFNAADGVQKWVRTIGKPVFEEGKITKVMGNIIDITKRKEKEKALRETEENFRRSLDDSPMGVRIVSEKGETLYVNKAALDIFGCDSIEEWRAIPTMKRYTEQSYAKYKIRREKRRLGEDDTTEYEIDIVRKGGEVRRLQVWRKGILWNGGNNYQVIYRDVTDIRNAREELGWTLERLRKAYSATIQVMVSAVETRDPYTAGHQIRSSDLARAIAKEIGLPQEKIDGIRMAASIHDIGKLSVPAEILSKPTKLSDIEFSLIKEHAHRGFEILREVESPWPLAEMVYQHHERMDGSGYPRNLKGDAILIESRILAVADVVEAMASHRPYRPALGIDKALEEIEKNSGTIYDKTVAGACLRLFREKSFKLEEARI